MAQKNAETNIALAKNSAAIAKASKEASATMKEIAIEVKKESSAIKTIAILGMMLLPRTFIAVSHPIFCRSNSKKERSLTRKNRRYFQCKF